MAASRFVHSTGKADIRIQKIPTMRARKKSAVALTALSLFLAGCGGSAGSSPQGPGTIRFGTQPGIITSSLVQATESLKAKGYDVKWVSFTSAGDEMQALAGGSIDIMAAGAAPEILLSTKYKNAVMVATTIQIGTQLIVPADSNIHSISDLRGKKIAYPGPGSQQYALLTSAFAHNGLKTTDVDLYKSDASGMLALLKQHTVDAFFAWNPFASEAVRTGAGRVLASSQDIFKAAGGKGTWISEAYIANKDFIKNQGAAVQDSLKSIDQAEQLCRSEQPKAVDIWAKQTNLEPAAIDFAIQQHFVICPPTIVPDKTTIQSMVQLMIEGGLIQGVDPSTFVNNFVNDSYAAKATGS